MEPIWQISTTGNNPLIATAVHDGHATRKEIAGLFALSNTGRLREEDPFTGQWTTVCDTQIVGLRSRFEVDLNRPREKAVYLTPDDAWGLNVWKSPLPPEVIAQSLAQYDAFYAEVHRTLTEIAEQFGNFVVFDLHSYNHRREGPSGPVADPQQNPEVNIGTHTIDHQRWGALIERFKTDLSAFDFLGRHLDVRENVKFQGGNFPRWIQANFPQTSCAIAIEFKKFFMDEWSGQPDPVQLETIKKALQSTVPGVLQELKKL